MSGTVDAGSVSHVGMVRSENQDYAGQDSPTDSAIAATRGRVFIVCDGMGGHHGGSIASELTVKGFLQAWQGGSAESLSDRVNASLGAANMQVRSRAKNDPALFQMGTTAVVVAIDGPTAVIAHIGDSRCYFFRGGRHELVTHDHTYVNELVQAGLITPEKAKTHHERNIITRCVGMADALRVDFSMRELENGDALLLCSDGLHNHVDSHEMQNAIAKFDSVAAAQSLVDLANARGGDDNITCMVLKIVDVGRPSRNNAEGVRRVVTRETPVAKRRATGRVEHGLATGDDITRVIDTSSLARQLNPGLSKTSKVLIACGVAALLVLVAKWFKWI